MPSRPGTRGRKGIGAATHLLALAGITALAAPAVPATTHPRPAAAQQTAATSKQAAASVRIFFIDVEGGQATLFVAPTGRSLLIDTGWPGNNGRDADRIAAAAIAAGLSQIDAVLITHYHTDHVGGVPQLAKRIPVGMFLDHGPSREFNDPATVAGWTAYQKLLATGSYQHRTMHPGELLPGWDGTGGPRATVISADGKLLDRPLPGGGAVNTYCGTADDQRPADVPAADTTENARSLGIAMDYGKLRILDLGDLTWDKERPLLCPVNKLGHVGLLVVSHHGFEQSSSPALVDAIAPVVAIMDNGAKKGGSTRVLDVVRSAPSKPALWQLHTSLEGGPAHNTEAPYVANGVGTGADAGNMIEVLAGPDGHLAVTNTRTGLVKEYMAP